MAYIINKSNGSTLTVINDFDVDNTSTSLNLIGKGYKDWGESLNENLVKLLENFANNTPPSNPINGQLWYDTSYNSLKIYNSTSSSWISVQLNIAGLSFYSQKFTTPVSGQVTGFINDNKIIGLFSDISVSADKLDNGSLFPSVNAQVEFSNGLRQGLNLSNNNSRIYGQNSLSLGVINSVSALNSIEINVSGSIISYFSLESKGNTKLELVLVSGSDIFRPNFYLPTSAGIAGNVLVSNGNNGVLYWDNINNLISKDKIFGHSGQKYVEINASASSFGIEFLTNNNFRMILDNDGNLGLDTNSPNYKIEIRSNISSNNVSIGLVNDNPVLDTSIDLNTYFNSGNSAKVNFIRGGNNINPVPVGETLGSVNWIGINPSINEQNVAKIRSVVTTAYPSAILGNLQFMISDTGGNLYNSLEINENGEVVLYYNTGSNYYIMPSSAGEFGSLLASNGANSKLYWRPVTDFEVLLTSFSIVGLSSISFYNIPPNSKRIIYIKNFSPQTNNQFRTTFYNTGGVSVGGSGIIREITSSAGGRFAVSAITAGTLTRTKNLFSSATYNMKVIVELDISGRATMNGELYRKDEPHNRFIFTVTNSGSLISTECTAIQFFVLLSAGYIKGSAEYYQVVNQKPFFSI